MGFKRSEKRMADIESNCETAWSATESGPGAGGHRALHYVVRAVWISRIARRQFRAAGLCQRVSEMPLPGGLHLRHAEQPADGILSPAILIKNAQRHGLRVLPVDVSCSQWECTVPGPQLPAHDPGILRFGLRYAKGLREETGRAIVRARPFSSVDDLAVRVPQLRKDEINRLAEIGALNSLEAHRRDALWQTQRAILPVGPLLEPLEEKGEPRPFRR